jgi:hypothetical protein
MSSDIVILIKIDFNNLMILIAFLEQKLAIFGAIMHDQQYHSIDQSVL